jgi:DNA-binding HxlR family transcriptional regulator
MKKPKRSVCPVACALDIIGDKWTMLVVRDIFLGRRYFKDFLSSPEGIATNILTERLKRLLDAGVVRALPDEATVGRYRYTLTDKGMALAPVLEAVAQWGLDNIRGTSTRLKPHS